MGSHRIKMRLTGTKQDLEKWLWFVGKMDLYGLVEIINQSDPYANRGESKEPRVYLEINLNVQVSVNALVCRFNRLMSSRIENLTSQAFSVV